MIRLKGMLVWVGKDQPMKMREISRVQDKKLVVNNKTKSKLVEIIISNLAYNNSPDELELYFIQVSKDDNFKFEILKHCKGCVTASTERSSYAVLSQTLNLLRYIDKEIVRRGDIIKNRLGRVTEDLNIKVYNDLKDVKKLPVLMLWVDEAATLYKKRENAEENKLCNEAKEILKRIASTGRFAGVYLVNILQRASKEELEREVKINTNIWVAFSQPDSGGSLVAINDEKAAIGLQPRIFAFRINGGNISYGKTPFSAWSDNVKLLENKGYIRPDNDLKIRENYTHWYKEIDETEEENTQSKGKGKNKMTKDDFKRLNEKAAKMQEESKASSILIQKLNDTITTLREENHKLSNDNKSLSDKIQSIIKKNKSDVPKVNTNEGALPKVVPHTFDKMDIKPSTDSSVQITSARRYKSRRKK